METYKGWKIVRNQKPIPSKKHDYDFVHPDCDIDNSLYGTAESVQDAKNQIDEIEMELFK